MHRPRMLASLTAFAAVLAMGAAPSACAVAGPVPPSSMPLSPVGTPLTMQASSRAYRPTKPRAKGRHCTSLRRRKP